MNFLAILSLTIAACGLLSMYGYIFYETTNEKSYLERKCERLERKREELELQIRRTKEILGENEL